VNAFCSKPPASASVRARAYQPYQVVTWKEETNLIHTSGRQLVLSLGVAADSMDFGGCSPLHFASFVTRTASRFPD